MAFNPEKRNVELGFSSNDTVSTDSTTFSESKLLRNGLVVGWLIAIKESGYLRLNKEEQQKHVSEKSKPKDESFSKEVKSICCIWSKNQISHGQEKQENKMRNNEGLSSTASFKMI